LGSAFGQGKGPQGPGLTITSPDFEDGGVIPNKYTQAVPNPISPQLEWTHVPPGTVSFALILHDPDVAIGKKNDDVLHWMIFNIPGTATGLPQGVPTEAKLPDGAINAKNLRGGVGFMGPGMGAQGPYHHYTFELFALDTKLTSDRTQPAPTFSRRCRVISWRRACWKAGSINRPLVRSKEGRRE
jgi:hypothetical protein